MRNKFALALVGPALAALLAARAHAQQTQAPPLFRAGADLVAVDVVVHDKGAHPVLDLNPADFEVREDGKPQTIDQFYLVRGGAIAVAGPEASAGGATISPPPASVTHRMFVAIFDTDHLTPGGFKRVQSAALTLFAKEFQAGDVGGVVVNGEMANKHLTSDREELLAAVRSAKPNSKTASQLFDLRQWPSINDAEAMTIARYGLRSDPTLDDAVRRACADDPDACRRQPVDEIIYAKAQQIATEIRASSDGTLRTIAALMSGLERMEGRKTILLLSEGFIADASWPIVQQTVGAAARANARIYSLDARGLDKGRQPIGNYAPHDDTLGNLLASFDIGADSINSLAVDTGGYVVKNSNIFDQAVAEIAAEAGTYYVLGYRASAPPDGKFHKISVSVKRAGLTVRARRGYVASPGPARTTAATAPRQPAPAAPSAPNAAPAAPERADAAVPAPAAVPEIPVAAEAPVPPGPSRVDPADRRSAATGAEVRLRPDVARHMDLLGTAAESHDTNAEAGWAAYQRGDLESAHTSLAVAAAAPSARPWVHYALAQADYGLRLYRDAVVEWEKVLAAAPEFEPVYFDLVDGCLQLKDYDRATRTIRIAASRWPKDADVFNALGVVQVARGALDDAVKSFAEAVAVAPRDGVGYYNLARAHEMRYVRSRRYVTTTQTWVASKPEYDAAIENYNRYVEIGGPFEKAAREALSRLGWTPPPQ